MAPANTGITATRRPAVIASRTLYRVVSREGVNPGLSVPTMVLRHAILPCAGYPILAGGHMAV